LANLAPGRRRDAVAGLERGVDGGFQRGQGHWDSSGNRTVGRWIGRLFRDLAGESQGKLSVVPDSVAKRSAVPGPITTGSGLAKIRRRQLRATAAPCGYGSRACACPGRQWSFG